MERDLEMDICPKDTETIHGNIESSSEQILNDAKSQQDGSTSTHGKPRSNARMFAILIALFVRSNPGLLYVPLCAVVLPL